jgi:hypothetical protein
MTAHEGELLCEKLPDKHKKLAVSRRDLFLSEKDMEDVETPEFEINAVTRGQTAIEDALPSVDAALDEKPVLEDIAPSFRRKLTQTERHISYTFGPLAILKDRLLRSNLIEAQKRDQSMLHAWDKNGILPPNTELQGELLISTPSQLPLLPSELDGVALSYAHLNCAHAGARKMHLFLKQRYVISNLRAKCTDFSRSCYSCILVNPDNSILSEIGSFPIPSRPFETVAMDILTGFPQSGNKTNHLLVFCDAFSNFVHIQELKQASGKAVTDSLKSFLQFVGLSVRVLIADNAANFNQAKTLANSLGIKTPKTAAYESASRGEVEVQNRIILSLIRKMMILPSETNFHFDEVVFLATTLINESINPVTKVSPNEIVFGHSLVENGPFGLDYNIKHKFELLNLKDATTVKRKQQYDAYLEAKTWLLKEQESRLTRANKTRQAQPFFHPGDLVFVRDRRIAPVGVNIKLRTKYYPSLFEIVTSTQFGAIVRRFSDGLEMQVRPSRLKHFDSRDSELIRTLPTELFTILAGHITEQAAMKLAKLDPLPIIELHSPKLKRNQPSQAEDDDDWVDQNDYWEEELENAPITGDKQVRFAEDA